MKNDIKKKTKKNYEKQIEKSNSIILFLFCRKDCIIPTINYIQQQKKHNKITDRMDLRRMNKKTKN